MLIVELKQGPAPDPKALREFLRGKVAGWWIPDQVVMIAAMPLAATGKVDKKRLRDDHANGKLIVEDITVD